MGESKLIEKAADIIRQHGGKPDALLLSKELGIGYAQVARLLDTLEEQGVIEPRLPSPSSRRKNDGGPDYLLEYAIIGLAYMRGYVSPALLQRDMGLSYPVAVQLLDTLEDRNIIQRDGDNPRWTLNDAWRDSNP